MSFPAPRRFHTFREYLDLEEASNVRHEFFDGEIYAMAGGSPEHAALSAAVGGLLFGALRGGPCRVYSSDLRVRATASGLVTYPDVTVVCEAEERDPEGSSVLTNPSVVVEVLSPSTEAYDRGDKLEHYRQIESLQQIVLVSHTERAIETWTRDDGEWRHTKGGPAGSLDLPAVGVTLQVDDIYDGAGVSL